MIPGFSLRAPLQRPFRPLESGRFGGGFPGVAYRIPGVAPRVPFQRPFRPPPVRGGFRFTGILIGFPGILPGVRSSGHSGRRRCAAVSGSRGFSPGFIPAASQAAGERAIDRRIHGDSPRAPFQRPLRPQESERFGGGFHGVAPRIHGVSSPNPGDSHWIPGDSPRAPFQRPFRPPSVRGGFRFTGLHLGFTWILIGFPGILPGLHSSGLTGRRRCAAVSGSRGLSPGFIPAAIQAAGERAFRWRISPGCTPDSRGCISESRGFSPGSVPAASQAAVGARRFRVPGDSHWIPGDSPRAPFQRPFRPPSVRGGVAFSGLHLGFPGLHLGFPGFHLGFPGFHPGLYSRGHSGRRTAQQELRAPGTGDGGSAAVQIRALSRLSV